MANFLFKFSCSLISLISFIAAIFFSLSNQSALTGIWLTFSLFVFIIGWPEIAESISFLGNSIKLRQIKSSLKDIRLVIEANTRAIFELVQTQMRFGGVSEEQKDFIYNDLTDVLNKAGFSKTEIADIQERWHYWVKGDYVRRIININNLNHPDVPKEKKDIWSQKRLLFKESIDEVTPEQLRQAFKECDAYTDDIKELINDFEHYIKHKSHRRPDVWRKDED